MGLSARTRTFATVSAFVLPPVRGDGVGGSMLNYWERLMPMLCQTYGEDLEKATTRLGPYYY